MGVEMVDIRRQRSASEINSSFGCDSVAWRLVEQKTGVHYALYGYEGHPEAEYVIVVMGSGAVTCSETAKYLMEKGEKVWNGKSSNRKNWRLLCYSWHISR